MTDHRSEVDALLADYRHSRAQLASVQQRLRAVSATVHSPDGSVAVTVGPTGALTGLVLTDAAYQRFRPAELAAAVLRAAAEAGARVAAQAGEVLGPVLPPGSDPAAVLAGRADLADAELQPPPAPPADADDSFENRSWLHMSRPGGRT